MTTQESDSLVKEAIAKAMEANYMMVQGAACGHELAFSFILLDAEKNLPKNFPMGQFELAKILWLTIALKRIALTNEADRSAVHTLLDEAISFGAGQSQRVRNVEPYKEEPVFPWGDSIIKTVNTEVKIS